jgi:hypothetical protein
MIKQFRNSALVPPYLAQTPEALELFLTLLGRSHERSFARATPIASLLGGLTAALAAWGKVASDFCCGTFFNNNLVALVRRDHPLDFGVGVAGIDGEVCVLRPKCLVSGSRHLDALDTGCVPALADEVESLGSAPPEKLCQTLDPIVHLAEDRLVQTQAFLTKVHRQRC